MDYIVHKVRLDWIENSARLFAGSKHPLVLIPYPRSVLVELELQAHEQIVYKVTLYIRLLISERTSYRIVGLGLTPGDGSRA